MTYRNNRNNELRDTVHWRRFKEMANGFFELEKNSTSGYDFNHICCYSCIGSELQGTNVNYSVVDGCSCFVADNRYDFFEIPKYSNNPKYTGEYKFLAHNTSFDYWIFGDMKYTIRDNFETTATLNDRANFTPYGAYNVVLADGEYSITKTEYGKNVIYGGNKPVKHRFDRIGNRLKAYGTSVGKILNKKHNPKTIKGGNVVEIYKKKNRKGNIK